MVLEHPVVNISVFTLHGVGLSPAKAMFNDFRIDVAIGICNVHTRNFRETRDGGGLKVIDERTAWCRAESHPYQKASAGKSTAVCLAIIFLFVSLWRISDKWECLVRKQLAPHSIRKRTDV